MCGCKSIQNRGSRRGIKRYFCKDCNKSFSSNRRPERLQKKIFKEYFEHRQTLVQLAEQYHKSIPWVRKQINEYDTEEKVHKPREINLACDATFYGKRKAKLGTLIFKDNDAKEVVIWKHIEKETREDYIYLKNKLDNLGYTIQSVVLDGKSGIEKAFKDIPRQMCHFHMRQIIKRYITMNPKLEAGKDLKKIMSSLTRTTEKNFTSNIAAWYKKHEKFLAEKTKSSTTGKLHYTHPKLRSAYRSLMKHTPYLFTYKNRKYKHLNIQRIFNENGYNESR